MPPRSERCPPCEHIQQAIKHLMMAMVANDDEERAPGS